MDGPRGNRSRKDVLYPHPAFSMRWIALAVVGLSVACLSKQSDTPFFFPPASKPHPPAIEPLPKRGVELRAAAYGNVLWVTVINNSNREILVGPKYFAVRVGGRIYPVHPSTVAIRFPVKRLRRGDGASGVFRFTELTSLVGEQLVLNSPDAVVLKTEIKQRQAGVALPRGIPVPQRTPPPRRTPVRLR